MKPMRLKKRLKQRLGLKLKPRKLLHHHVVGLRQQPRGDKSLQHQRSCSKRLKKWWRKRWKNLRKRLKKWWRMRWKNPRKRLKKYTEEEKQEWYMVVYEGSTCETKEADKGAAKPSGTGVKHRPKQMALRKQAPKQAPKPWGRPRKVTQPKKFTTPEQTKRICSRSQWVSTPFTEANTDEIEGRKKKPRTKA
nr:unnamed protein product [Brassica oleracea]